ncbi:MarR family EPS-associated transcriptional regulator [Spiribacter onubensis]|uniref:MarR family EPS-associated transcriptional regulator n=1 Tax=Spiribacter onubensis TaxID=3122420 RepID=A0ABV3SAQ8_9GAMM
MTNTSASLDEALALRALQALETDPNLSQRALARELGVSLGKTNYCLHALMDKGLVKLQNFQHNPRKIRYAYLLTPQGIEEKTRMTWRFLRRKEAEYEALQAEIAELRRRVAADAGVEGR